MDLYKRERRLKGIKNNFKDKCQHCFNIVEEFERNLRVNNYSVGRIEKYWSSLKTIHNFLNKCFDKVEKKDIEDLLIKIDSNENWSEWTKVDFKKMLKIFYRWLINKTLQGEYPELVKWIRPKMKKNNEKTPEQILTKEEVEMIAKHAENSMEKAFVLCLYETGCRIGEFLNIRIKDIQFDSYGCYILVSGKTGWRRVRVIDYSKDLLEWLDAHPTKQNPESFLWIDPKKQERIFPDMANHLLKKLGKKAGIQKVIHAHAFRHARATELAKILSEQQLKVYFGWVNDSKMASVYVHLSGKDVDEALLKAKGIKVSREEKTKPMVKTCSRCGESNSPYVHFCKKCGNPLDVKASFEMEKFEELLIEFFKVLAKEFPQTREKFWEIVKKKGMEEVFKD